MQFQASRNFAKQADQNDPLKHFRPQYLFPEKDGKASKYFCGNSLGLQPKNSRKYLDVVFRDWQKFGVEGHMHSEHPWYYYQHNLTAALAKIVGADRSEVAAMNSLTTNLNLTLVSFYKPTDRRKKILIDAKAFPSDYYALEQQIRMRGYDPAYCIVELPVRHGAHTSTLEDTLAAIEQLGDELALVMIGGVNYYTGQLFDMQAITKAAHKVGAFAGFDLAHAVGNVPLQLHQWNVDFAVWCSYKYLNSGPGGVGGVFIHDKHANNKQLDKLAGWWGVDESTRFEMRKHFEPFPGVASWQMSNVPVFSMAVHWAALDLFDQTSMAELRAKSLKLTAYMELLILEKEKVHQSGLQIITPTNPQERGAQLSLLTGPNGKAQHQKLTDNNVVADWRNPNVIRVAPVPMYNSFEDVFDFVELFYS